MPIDSCDDGAADISSFAHAILTFRPRAGRKLPTDPDQLFERFFIGLYEHDGPSAGEIGFYDVTTERPPRRGRPGNLMSLDEMIGEVIKAYGIRNRRYMEWADEDGLLPDLESSPEEEAESGPDGDAGDEEEA
jgi:hypothetical protein